MLVVEKADLFFDSVDFNFVLVPHSGKALLQGRKINRLSFLPKLMLLSLLRQLRR